MELIFTYIDNYREFKDTGILFSNKFNVSYEKEKNKLSIEKNIKYRKIYPNNILNISAIVGKNASGKTSLLELIGLKVESRFNNKEMIVRESSNPHKKFELSNLEKHTKGIGEYISSYFFIYHLDSEDTGDIFVFETNNPKMYIEIFENNSDMTKKEKEFGYKLLYYEEKCWFPYVFQFKGEKATLLHERSYSLFSSTDSCDIEPSIVLFHNNRKISANVNIKM